jgi:hypothetical protein
MQKINSIKAAIPAANLKFNRFDLPLEVSERIIGERAEEKISSDSVHMEAVE